MKKIIFIISIIFIGCNTTKKFNLPKSNIEAKCEQIIIMDSIDFKTIAFVVSFKNKSENNIVLFANSAYKKTIEDSYTNAGILIKKDSFVSPIGIYVPKIIFLEPNTSKKYVFLFSKQYPNDWINISKAKNDREELTLIAKKSKLLYKYNANEMQKIFNSEEMKKIDAKTINEDFEVEINNPKIEYNNNLSIEDVIKISGGKIREVSN